MYIVDIVNCNSSNNNNNLGTDLLAFCCHILSVIDNSNAPKMLPFEGSLYTILPVSSLWACYVCFTIPLCSIVTLVQCLVCLTHWHLCQCICIYLPLIGC